MPRGIATLFLASLALAQDASFEGLRKYFEYDRSLRAGETLGSCQSRGKIQICDFSYNSPDGGRVPGTLVIPDGRGPHAVILFGHWMMKGSPMRGRAEFLEEAVVLAGAGAMSLLIDTPLVRPGFVEDPDPLAGQGAKAAVQMAKDWRRGLDLLLTRKDTDKNRIAYVGHSFSAGVGAKLTAIEKRIGSFVLMANVYSNRDLIFDPDNPEMVAIRKQVGDQRIEKYFQDFPFDDSAPFVSRSSPAAIFLQFGRKDKPIREPIARKSFLLFGEPKRMEFYDAGHELDGRARSDRVEWLRERLALKKIDANALRSIPQLQ